MVMKWHHSAKLEHKTIEDLTENKTRCPSVLPAVNVYKFIWIASTKLLIEYIVTPLVFLADYLRSDTNFHFNGMFSKFPA